MTDVWRSCEETARHLAGKPVLYAIGFSHGKMKIGSTANMHRRLLGITSHGLFRDMVTYLATCPCPANKLLAAERSAHQAMSARSTVLGPEIYSVVPCGLASDVLATAVETTEDRPDRAAMTPDDMLALAISTGMYGALEHTALQWARLHAASVVIDFMEPSNHDTSALAWHRACASVPPLAHTLLPTLIIENGELMVKGVSYDARKKILEQYAIDIRSEQLAMKSQGAICE